MLIDTPLLQRLKDASAHVSRSERGSIRLGVADGKTPSVVIRDMKTNSDMKYACVIAASFRPRAAVFPACLCYLLLLFFFIFFLGG